MVERALWGAYDGSDKGTVAVVTWVLKAFLWASRKRSTSSSREPSFRARCARQCCEPSGVCGPDSRNSEGPHASATALAQRVCPQATWEDTVLARDGGMRTPPCLPVRISSSANVHFRLGIRRIVLLAGATS
jgi:hypothetical protein